MNDERNVVLSNIFEFLITNGRQDLVNAYKNCAYKGKIKDKICTARKKWKCCRCRRPIHKGEKYVCKDYSNHDGYILMRYCFDCAGTEINKEIKKTTLSKMRFIKEENL